MAEKKCNICGIPGSPPFVIQLENGEYAECCQNCFKQLDTCNTCAKHILNCAFKTDPSTLPFSVQKIEQSGPMRKVSYIQNPERMAITCPGCPCYQDEQCRKTEQCYNRNIRCENYQIKLTP